MPTTPPTIRFCTSRDGTRIAYAASGEGLPLVKALHLASQLETEADHPVLGAMLQAMAAGRKLVRYDRRGFGLSDRDVGDFSLQRHLEDFAAVADAAGLARFAIVGLAGGGAVAEHFGSAARERRDIGLVSRQPARPQHRSLAKEAR